MELFEKDGIKTSQTTLVKTDFLHTVTNDEETSRHRHSSFDSNSVCKGKGKAGAAIEQLGMSTFFPQVHQEQQQQQPLLSLLLSLSLRQLTAEERTAAVEMQRKK